MHAYLSSSSSSSTTTRDTARQTYVERLLTELDAIRTDYAAVLAASRIVNIDPNRHGGGIVVIGAAKWGWSKSDAALETARMALLHQLRDWAPRFRLLFPHPTPTVASQLDKNLHRLERWLVRKSRELGVPSTIEEATEKISTAFANLRALTKFLPPTSTRSGSLWTPTR